MWQKIHYFTICAHTNNPMFLPRPPPYQTVFLPGETPAMAMGYPYASLGRELKRMKKAHKFTTEELDKLIVYKKGRDPSR